jgi:L-iditol 2-dehydrogenase
MKAAYLVEKGKVDILDAPKPEIKKENEALVKIKSVGICGSDIHYYKEGKIGDQIVNTQIILGHEAAGEVVETGKSVNKLKPGDKVAVEPGISCGNCELCKAGKPNLCPYVKFLGTPPVDGAFKEYLVMPQENLFLIPEGLGFEEGVLSEPLAIGLYGVKLSSFKIGDEVVVLGAGPIGLSAVISLKTAGAGRIFVSDLLQSRIEFAEKIGADVTVLAGQKDKDIVSEVNEYTAGNGVDISYEAAGERETQNQLAETVKIGGEGVIYGIPANDKIEFSAAHVVRRKEMRIINVRRSLNATLLALNLMKNSPLPFSDIITHRFPFSQVNDALNLVAEYQQGVIKAVINF